MNDRYLFRAKRIDNGEWVEGYLVETRHNTYHDGYRIIDKDGINYDELDYYEPSFISYVIDKTTICQYTGLKDKNGNLIWENDVVRIVGHHSDVNGVYKIIFDEINHCWALERSYDYPRSYFTFSDLNGFAVDCEVIGNIFDNPELINE